MRRLTRIMAAAVFGLLVGTAASQAQPTQLINPTTTQWRYLADNTDQGVAWSAKVFDDSTWQTGTGLFGNDTGYPYPFATAIPGPSGGGPLVEYFRTKFTWNGTLNGIVLTGTNYIDDGDVLYLNGVEITRFNMPAGAPTFATVAPAANPGGFPNLNNGEPVLVTMQIPLGALTNGNANPLVVGENTLAVEIHNNGTGSSDTVFGMSLYAQQSLPPCTDNIQPTDRSVTACRNTTFTVVLPTVTCNVPFPSIQWFRSIGGVDSEIIGQTGTSVTLTNVQPTDAGQYFAVLNNGVGAAVQSRHAVLTVTPDTQGPQVLSVQGTFGADNEFLVTFDEAIRTQQGGDDAFTWEITDVNDPSATFLVQNIAIVTGRPDQVLFTTDIPRIAGHMYRYRTTQDITDDCGGSVTPPGLTGPVLVQGTILDYTDAKIWRYDDTAVNRDAENWKAAAYNDSAWKTGQQLFDRQRADLTRTTVAGQTVRTFLELTNFAANPPTNIPTFYLRVKLTVPAGTTALTGFPIYDDGFILYVNGNEVYRTNVLATADQFAIYGGAGAINAGDATRIYPFEIPISAVTVGGENTIAVMLKQNDPTSSDVTFGLRIVATSPGFPVEPIVILQQPVSTTVTEGHALSLSVSVSGSQPSYQWFKDNVEIPGATSATYTKSAVAGDAGTYHVVVSNPQGPVTSASATVTVRPVAVPYNATWRYETNSQDATLSSGTPWYAPAFNDSTWQSGPGLFGVETTAGTLARLPAPINTALPTPSATFLTAYFRTTVTVPTLSAGQSLALFHTIDDGAVFYVDGVLALRYNMTNDPPILSTAVAPGTAPGDGDAMIVVTPVTLPPGQHTIAAEVHQNAGTSSDIVFGAELRVVSGTGPTLTIAHPTPTSVTVTWAANPLYSLYQATVVTGPYTPVGGNPQGTHSVANIAPDAARYFQLRLNGQ